MLVFTLLAAGIMAVVIFFLAIYFVCRFSAEEEDGDAWLPWVLVVLVLVVASYMVLLLPFEVALKGDCPNFDFAWAWKIILGIAYALLFVGGPFAFAFYESWSPHQPNMWAQLRPALVAVAAVNGVFALSFTALWLWGSKLDPKDGTLTHVMPFEYFVATASTFGWLFFFLFAGIGLAAVPVHGAVAFLQRPRPITKAEYDIAKVKLNMEVQQLLDRGRRLDAEMGGGRPSRQQRQRMLLFKRDVRTAETQSERNEAAFHLSGAVIVRSYCMAAMTVVNTAMTILWVLQIFLGNLLKLQPLLDPSLIWLDRLLSLLATLTYTYCALYLMWCTIVGWRTISGSLFITPVYPLHVRGTMLNALLFNALLLLCASFAVLQLCVVSFPAYTASTTLHTIFTVSIAHMYGVQHVAQFMQYGLLTTFFISVPWLLFCPRFMTSHESDEDEVESLV